MILSEWLNHIESLHVSSMDLSLERVFEVAKRLNLTQPTCPVILVGGTNGKGSCVAGLEAIYKEEGYRVGVFTSPILIKYNEYVRIQGIEATDTQFCDAFKKIEEARQDITLTPFEFSALAAFDIFQKENCDIWILEVGLGGRFDATNIMDADVAIISSIGIDHVEWLGNTREKIGFEKAGIFRKNKIAICGDFDPPTTLIKYAHDIGASLFCQKKDFSYEKKSDTWKWWSKEKYLDDLFIPHLALQNMATVLMTVNVLQKKVPVKEISIRNALNKVKLAGRIQVIPGEIMRIFDVSHNPASAEFLANWLRDNPIKGKTRAVFSMLNDKDIEGTVEVIKSEIDEWHIAALPIKRGAAKEKLIESVCTSILSFPRRAECCERLKNIKSYASVIEAYDCVERESKVNDRIVVFGSFHTVAAVLNKEVLSPSLPPL